MTRHLFLLLSCFLFNSHKANSSNFWDRMNHGSSTTPESTRESILERCGHDPSDPLCRHEVPSSERNESTVFHRQSASASPSTTLSGGKPGSPALPPILNITFPSLPPGPPSPTTMTIAPSLGSGDEQVVARSSSLPTYSYVLMICIPVLLLSALLLWSSKRRKDKDSPYLYSPTSAETHESTKPSFDDLEQSNGSGHLFGVIPFKVRRFDSFVPQNQTLDQNPQAVPWSSKSDEPQQDMLYHQKVGSAPSTSWEEQHKRGQFVYTQSGDLTIFDDDSSDPEGQTFPKQVRFNL